MLCARPIPVSSMPPHHTGMPRSAVALWTAIASEKPPTRPTLMLMMRQESMSIAASASRRLRIDSSRQIGLLRAVGMRRRQVRAMIRSEAVILAIFGAIIGIVIGTGLGIALVSSLKQQGITDTVVPASSLVIFLLLAALLGLIAASWPARRAAKLDVLAAIAAQQRAP